LSFFFSPLLPLELLDTGTDVADVPRGY